jgi:hypothetical protein
MAMDQALEAITSALVAVIGGEEARHYAVSAEDVQVKRYSRMNFLIFFSIHRLLPAWNFG